MSGLGVLCMVALNEVGPLDLFALRRAAQTVAPRSTLTIERRRAPPAETVLIVDLDGERLALHGAPGRIPEREYQAGIAGNLFWPEAVDAMARHRAIVTVCGMERAEGLPAVRAQAAAVTRLAAAVAEATGACGAHWLGTGSMASPARLIAAAREIERRRWPADLWLGYVALGVERPGARPLMGARSEGATEYLGAEIEVPPYEAADRLEPIRVLFAGIGRLIGRGAPLAEGIPVEPDAPGHPRRRLRAGPDGVMLLEPEAG